MSIVHKIEMDSPLYEMSYLDMIQNRFEIVVILEGTIESTGQSIQARSSYLNSEILWGFDFHPVIFYDKQKQNYQIDYTQFNTSSPITTPLKSSRELQDELREAEKMEGDQFAISEKGAFLGDYEEDVNESENEPDEEVEEKQKEFFEKGMMDSEDNLDWKSYLGGSTYNTAVWVVTK